MAEEPIIEKMGVSCALGKRGDGRVFDNNVVTVVRSEMAQPLRKTKRFEFRCSAEFKTALQKYARRSGISVTEWIERCILKAMKK